MRQLHDISAETERAPAATPNANVSDRLQQGTV